MKEAIAFYMEMLKEEWEMVHLGKHHWRSVRLPGYDYTQAGAYSVTVCAHNR